MITTTIRIERHNWRIRGREPRGYVKDQGSTQHLVKRWHWRGLVVWTRILDSEEIPMWALCQLGAFGDTDWESRLFREHRHLLHQ